MFLIAEGLLATQGLCSVELDGSLK